MLHCSTIGIFAICRRYAEGMRKVYDFLTMAPSLFPAGPRIHFIQEQPLNLQDVSCIEDYGENEIGD